MISSPRLNKKKKKKHNKSRFCRSSDRVKKNHTHHFSCSHSSAWSHLLKIHLFAHTVCTPALSSLHSCIHKVDVYVVYSTCSVGARPSQHILAKSTTVVGLFRDKQTYRPTYSNHVKYFDSDIKELDCEIMFFFKNGGERGRNVESFKKVGKKKAHLHLQVSADWKSGENPSPFDHSVVACPWYGLLISRDPRAERTGTNLQSLDASPNILVPGCTRDKTSTSEHILLLHLQT